MKLVFGMFYKILLLGEVICASAGIIEQQVHTANLISVIFGMANLLFGWCIWDATFGVLDGVFDMAYLVFGMVYLRWRILCLGLCIRYWSRPKIC